MNRWDTKWAELQSQEHRKDEPHPLVIEFSERLRPGRALDVACGVGRNAIYLAECGWRVTAVDYSKIAIEILLNRASELNLQVDALIADLETDEFKIEPDSYDLIVNCCYLQRDLFPAIKSGVNVGGVVIAIIAMLDNDPQVKPMNREYLLEPGELRTQFAGWELLYDAERKTGAGKRAMAEIVARRNSVGDVVQTPQRKNFN